MCACVVLSEMSYLTRKQGNGFPGTGAALAELRIFLLVLPITHVNMQTELAICQLLITY